MTSHRRRSDVILTSCACWVVGKVINKVRSSSKSVKPKVCDTYPISYGCLIVNTVFYHFFLSSVPERRGLRMEKVKKKNGSPPCSLSKDTSRIEINCNTS